MAGKKRKHAPGDVATNRQARFRYELLDKVEAGMVLQGTEVKALRAEGAQMTDAYATVTEGEVWLHNLHIPPYKPAAMNNHSPTGRASSCCTGARSNACWGGCASAA